MANQATIPHMAFNAVVWWVGQKKKFDGKRSKYVSSIICRIHFFLGCFFCVASYKTQHMTFGSKLTTRRDAQQHVRDRQKFSRTAALEDWMTNYNPEKLYTHLLLSIRTGYREVDGVLLPPTTIETNNTTRLAEEFCFARNEDNSLDQIPNPPSYYDHWSREQRRDYCECVVSSSDITFSDPGGDKFITAKEDPNGHTNAYIAYHNFPLVNQCADKVDQAFLKLSCAEKQQIAFQNNYLLDKNVTTKQFTYWPMKQYESYCDCLRKDGALDPIRESKTKDGYNDEGVDCLTAESRTFKESTCKMAKALKNQMNEEAGNTFMRNFGCT